MSNDSVFQTAISKLKSQQKAERILCIVVASSWVVASIAMAVCLVLCLSIYPQQQNDLQNKYQTYEFQWQGGQRGVCSVCSGSSFISNTTQNVTGNFDLPSDWNLELTSMDDAYYTINWATYDCYGRVYLSVFSNDVLMHFQQLDFSECFCGECRETIRYMESAFHSFYRENLTVWKPRLNNTISLQTTNGSICVTRTKLDIRYSTDLFKDYSDVVNKIWWSGIGLAVFAVVIPLLMCGQAIRICRRPKSGIVSITKEPTTLDEDALLGEQKKEKI